MRSFAARTIGLGALLCLVGQLQEGFVSPPQPSEFRREALAAVQRKAAPPLEELGLGDLTTSVATAYMEALSSYPIKTKMMTAAGLVAAGDAISQATEKQTTKKFSYDVARGISFAIFGATYTGAFQHWWFQVLNSQVSAPLHADTSEQVIAAVIKTCLCQFGTIPLIYVPFFFIITGALRGLSLGESWERARALYLPLLRRNVLFWIPVQLIQFLVVPLDLQVPYCCVAGLIWSVILSQIAGPLKPKNAEKDKLAGPLVPGAPDAGDKPRRPARGQA